MANGSAEVNPGHKPWLVVFMLTHCNEEDRWQFKKLSDPNNPTAFLICGTEESAIKSVEITGDTWSPTIKPQPPPQRGRRSSDRRSALSLRCSTPRTPRPALESGRPSRKLPVAAPVAQLDRASVFGTEGYRFKSCRVYSAAPGWSSHHCNHKRIT